MKCYVISKLSRFINRDHDAGSHRRPGGLSGLLCWTLFSVEKTKTNNIRTVLRSQ